MDILLGESIIGTMEAKVELQLGKLTSMLVVTAPDEGKDELEQVITGMYRTLAWLGLVGAVDVYFDCWSIANSSAEDEEEVDAVLRKLYGEAGPTITPEDVVRVRREVSEESAGITAGLDAVSVSVKEEGLRRGLNKEEREKMTLEEARTNDED